MGTTPTRDTRTAILDTAEDILQRRSFNSFSYQHISQALGLRKASLHYHFPCKTDLGLALIDRYREQFRVWAEAVTQSCDDELSALEAYIERFEGCIARSQICPGGVLSTEFNTIDEPMQVALRSLYDEQLGWLADVLAAGRDHGVLEFPGSPETQAALMSTTVQGALQQARSCGPERFRQALDQLLALIAPNGSYTG